MNFNKRLFSILLTLVMLLSIVHMRCMVYATGESYVNYIDFGTAEVCYDFGTANNIPLEFHNTGLEYIKCKFSSIVGDTESFLYEFYDQTISIPPGSSGALGWIRPKNGLPAGAYTATLTFKDKSKRVTVNVQVSFSVTDSAITTHKVTFDTNGGTMTGTNPVTLNYGETVAKPANPTKESSTFDGWYEDNTYNVKFDFTKPITADITIYAKWKSVHITVTGISIETPGKTAYTVGDTMDLTGMTINVEKFDGISEIVPVTAAMVSGFDSSVATSSQTLTISYEGKTTTYDVSISDTAPTTYTATFKYGDENNLSLWSALLMISIVGRICVGVFGKKKGKHFK